MSGPLARPGRWFPTAAALAFIAALTLRPAPAALIPLPVFCLVCGDLGGVDVILNTLLFLPLGAALAAAGVGWRAAVVAAALTSLGVELLQFSLVGGRDASLSDLLTNTMGGALGAWAVRRWRVLLAPSRETARLLSVSAAALVMAVLAATAALLQPSIPPMGLWGQWAPPQHPSFEPYSGTMHDFVVEGIHVPYRLVPESEPLRQRLLDGDFDARLAFTAGRPTRRISAIGRLGSRFQEVLFVGANGTDLVFRTRLEARDWRVRAPSIAVPRALPAEGTPVVVEVGVRRHVWRARVADAAGATLAEREVPFGVALGWTMLLPFEHPLRPGDGIWSALWLAALAVPAGFWAAGGGERRRDTFGRWWWLTMSMMAVALAAVPALARFAPAPAHEWGGLVAGGVIGALLAAPLRARAGRRAGMRPPEPERQLA